MRAGVVGAGHMGQYHILVYAELWDVELVGLVDTDAGKVARLAAQYDTQGFTDYHDLFGKVDVVSIAVPTPLHFEVAREHSRRAYDLAGGPRSSHIPQHRGVLGLVALSDADISAADDWFDEAALSPWCTQVMPPRPPPGRFVT